MKNQKMNRAEAIEYLEEREIIDNPYITKIKERNFSDNEEKEIIRVMELGKVHGKEARIYGDPLVEM